jgi:hypothetical protein
MHTNLYLVEKLDRQRHQEFIAQAARTRTVAQLTNMKTIRSQTMKRTKLIAAAILLATTLLGAGHRAFTASQSGALTVASLCCYVK